MRMHGDDPMSRSATAERSTVATHRYTQIVERGANTSERPLTHAWISLRRRSPIGR